MYLLLFLIEHQVFFSILHGWKANSCSILWPHISIGLLAIFADLLVYWRKRSSYTKSFQSVIHDNSKKINPIFVLHVWKIPKQWSAMIGLGLDMFENCFNTGWKQYPKLLFKWTSQNSIWRVKINWVYSVLCLSEGKFKRPAIEKGKAGWIAIHFTFKKNNAAPLKVRGKLSQFDSHPLNWFHVCKEVSYY